MASPPLNHWVQATPGCAFCLFPSQCPGAPDPYRLNAMRKILLILSSCLTAWAAVASGSSSSPFVQIRLVLDARSDDSEQMVYVHKLKRGEYKETLYVQKADLLDETALESATVITGTPEGSPRIELIFTAKGTKHFALVTRQNIGKRLAIIIRGRLYSTPKVGTEIPSGTLQVVGSWSEPEANDLVAQIAEMIKESSIKK